MNWCSPTLARILTKMLAEYKPHRRLSGKLARNDAFGPVVVPFFPEKTIAA